MSYGFDATAVPNSDPGDDYGTIPPGIYDAQLDLVEAKRTKAGNGEYFNCQWRVLGPQYANRCVFETITWSNPNPEAVRIGHEQLGKMCKAIGLRGFNQLAELVGGRCQVRVGIEKQEGYDDRNRIKSYIPYAQQGAPPMQQSPPGHVPPQYQQHGAPLHEARWPANQQGPPGYVPPPMHQQQQAPPPQAPQHQQPPQYQQGYAPQQPQYPYQPSPQQAPPPQGPPPAAGQHFADDDIPF